MLAKLRMRARLFRGTISHEVWKIRFRLKFKKFPLFKEYKESVLR